MRKRGRKNVDFEKRTEWEREYRDDERERV